MQIVGQRGVIPQTALFAAFARIHSGVDLSRFAFLNIPTNYWRFGARPSQDKSNRLAHSMVPSKLLKGREGLGRTGKWLLSEIEKMKLEFRTALRNQQLLR